MIRAIALLGCLLLQLTGCSTTPAPVDELPAPGRVAAAAPMPPGHHQVQRGDTLYSIAFQYGYSDEQVAAWNGIAPPYVIRVGQRLRVMPPEATEPSTIRVLPAEIATAPIVAQPTPSEAGSSTALPTAAPAASSAVPAPAATPAAGSAAAPPEKIPTGPLRWMWPAQGRLLHGFAPDRPGGKGIGIAGRLGRRSQPPPMVGWCTAAAV